MYKWRSMLRVQPQKSMVQQPSDGTEGGGGSVCLVARSPYRILRSAASGNLKNFQKLYLEDPKRLDFRDEQRGRGAAHYAASNNKTEILQYILSVGGDIFGKDNQGQTPLHVAVETSSLDAVSILIDCGAALDTLNSWQQSPFHLAVSADRPEVLRLLLTYRHLVDCTQLTEHGGDALHIAAVLNRAECARILLNDFGMRPDHVCRNGFIPMHEAARRASLDAMQVLALWDEQHKTNLIMQPDADGSLSLHLAVHSGDVKMVKLCVNFGAIITSQQSDFSTPVHLACVQGSLEMTQLMLTEQPKEKWVVMDQRDAASMTILHCAAKFDHNVLVEYLHQQGADMAAVDSEQRTPLLLAAEQASWSAVHTLLALGSAPDTTEKRRRNLVHFLVLNGGQLQQLINANPKNTSALVKLLNGQDYEGSTPLHYASRDGQVRCMQELLQHGAGPDVKNAFNENPLHCASRSGRYQAVEVLLASEMSQYIINGIDQAGRTPLHGACDNGHLRVVHLLISRGALLNRDFEGMSALHLAVREGYTRTMRLLLGTHTQLLDQKDKAGNTALHLACQANQPAAVGLLLSYDCTLVANAAGYTALDIGIKQKLTEVVRVMLTNKADSRRALSDTQGKNKYTTAALIDFMPKIMKDVMDQHITVASDKKNAEMLSITYDLGLFEPCELQIQAIRTARGDADWRPQPLTAVNHMVRHGQIELLMHPLTQKYLEMKWSAYGRVCHMLSLMLYTGFVILETTHGMHLMMLVGKCKVLLEDEGTLVLTKQTDPTEDEDSCAATSRVFFSSRASPVEHATMLAVIVFGALNVFRKAVQLWSQGWRFIVGFENYLELCLYLSAVFSVTPVLHPVVHHVHIISTAMAIFLAWFKMLLYLRSFESVGIYVVMFVEIQKTLLRVLVIFSLLIIAFGLAFFILMSPGNHPEFNSVQVALSRTFNMMLGEIDFLTVYVYPGMAATVNGTSSVDRTGGGRRVASAGSSGLGARFLPFATSSFLLVIVFMVMIPILLMNLLVGLAVGDIETVRKNAALKRLAMQVDLHTSLEGKLPRAFLEKVRCSEVVEYPHEVGSGAATSPSQYAYRGVIRFVMHLFTPSHGGAQRTFDHLEHEAAAEQNRQRQEIGKLKRRLKANSDAIDSVLHLVRMMAARMEVGAEGQDEAGVGVERSLRRNDLERAASARSNLRLLPP